MHVRANIPTDRRRSLLDAYKHHAAIALIIADVIWIFWGAIRLT
jgi:hypothetical protein